MTSTAPYGSWPSPISVSMLSQSAIKLGEVTTDGDDVYWTESRASEGGRTVIVRRDARGVTSDAVPPGFNARTRAHEYGGGSYAVHDGVVISCDFEDQRVYRIDGGEPVPITPEPDIPAGDRYADFVFHGDRVICVRERHHEDREATNSLVVFPLDGVAEPQVIVEGSDFYSTPRVSPDGSKLAWLVWDHPRMPWDGTELWTAALAPDGTVSEPEIVAGGEEESIFQPEWSPNGVLHFVSDRSGWWNLHRSVAGETEILHGMESEFGVPQWVFGMRRYAFMSDGRITAIHSECGSDSIAVLSDGVLTPVPGPFDVFGASLGMVGDKVFAIGGSSDEAMAVVGVDVVDGSTEVVRTSLDVDLEPDLISAAKPIQFGTTDGAIAHAFYYPPRNPLVTAPGDERPPLVLMNHGGPTSSTSSDLKLGVQFWTSRGFAVVDVNYRGSSGYGREYRNALLGNWGVVDLDDCLNAALYLADEDLVDIDRMAIRGGSAGGYTTLCALAFSDVFSAGASYFGVGDLAMLATETHKFESRYLDGLIGPYPEASDLYDERSPAHNLDDFDTPAILFQGLDDRVVLPNQAEGIVAALDERGIPHAYVAYAGEGHGFRRAENIERSYEAELYFYCRAFGIEPAGDLEPVDIVHEDAL